MLHAIFPKCRTQIGGSAHRDDKQSGERQQNRPVRLRRIGLGDCLLVARKESFPLARLERVEERAEAGSFQPLDNRVRAGERMKVSRAPDIDARRVGAQQAEIPLGAVRG